MLQLFMIRRTYRQLILLINSHLPLIILGHLQVVITIIIISAFFTVRVATAQTEKG